jgi:hypothetical protein
LTSLKSRLEDLAPLIYCKEDEDIKPLSATQRPLSSIVEHSQPQSISIITAKSRAASEAQSVLEDICLFPRLEDAESVADAAADVADALFDELPLPAVPDDPAEESELLLPVFWALAAVTVLGTPLAVHVKVAPLTGEVILPLVVDSVAVPVAVGIAVKNGTEPMAWKPRSLTQLYSLRYGPH